MKWPPTDLQIVEEIYRRHYDEFSRHSRELKVRDTKVYVPIRVKELADHFGVDGDIIFGRLYYHLEPKYGFKKGDGSEVRFFDIQLQEDRHVVQFPLLAAVVADLRDKRRKHLIATWLSVVALIFSAVSIGVAWTQ